MESIKKFLDPGDKGQQIRNLSKVYIYGFISVFSIGFFGGLYIYGSILMGVVLGTIVSLPFVTVGVITYLISVIGINKNWSKNSWRIFSLLMVLVGLAILLWNLTR